MKSRTSILFVAALALSLGAAADSSVYAQPHGPGGPSAKAGPTPAKASIDAKLAAGTVVITVVDGSLEAPLADIEVQLSTPEGRLQQRTDVDGTATFSVKLGNPNALYKASAKAKGKDLASEVFGARAKAGVSIVMTTRPIGPGLGGRPSSRMMSGRARPERNDPSGRLTVRAITGELLQSQFGGLTAPIPEGALIHLVGMHADGTMEVNTEKVLAEKEGRVIFDKLARDNSIAYYAMTTFAREGGTDRLMTQALKMPPQIGSRMMFAGAPTESAAPGLDDLGELAGVSIAMPDPGQVKVQVFAEESQVKLLEQAKEVVLVEVGNPESKRKASIALAPPNPMTIQGESTSVQAIEGTEALQVSFRVLRLSTKRGIGAAIVTVKPAKADPANPIAPLVQTADATGVVHFPALQKGISYVATVNVHGKVITGKEFTVSEEHGTSFAFAFQWRDQAIMQALFEGVEASTSKIYIAQVFSGGRRFLSVPFQMIPEKGAAVGIYMYPEILFSLHGGAELDDQKMWFQTQLSIANPSIAPYLAKGTNKYSIPLPKGFVGASVADEMASRIGVESDKGFFWRGAVPPGQQDFIASFALPVEGGAMKFDMALPRGLRAGRIVVDDLPGMELRTPGGAEVSAKVRPNGRKFLEMANISIAPQQRLLFAIRGLPQYSPWRKHARRGAGVAVVLLLLWAGYVVFFGAKTEEQVDPVLSDLESTKEKLLEQMVNLETEYRHKRGDDKEKPYKKQRDKLNTRLVDIYRKIDAHKMGNHSAN